MLLKVTEPHLPQWKFKRKVNCIPESLHECSRHEICFRALEKFLQIDRHPQNFFTELSVVIVFRHKQFCIDKNVLNVFEDVTRHVDC